MVVILILIVVTLLVVYIKVKYFTLRGSIPGSSPHILFGNLIESGHLFGGLTLPVALASFKKRFGDIFQFWLGPTHVIVVGNIHDIKHILKNRNIYDQGDIFIEKVSVIYPDTLFCLKGAAYKRHAALVASLFRRGKVVHNLDIITACTEKLLSNWRTKPPGTIHTDIIQQSQVLMLAIFGFIGFDYDLETLDDDNNELARVLQYKLNLSNIIAYLPKFLSKTFINFSHRFRQSESIISKYLSQMIEKELNETEEARAERKRTCLIASLVSSLQQDESAEAIKNEKDKKGLSRMEILNETVAFLNAGFYTTSTSLAWFIHLMSKHPHVQQKIKKEISKDNADNELTLDRLDSFVYLDCVIKEVLRFCPPVPAIVRTLTTDDCLPDSGFQLHKGEQILIPLHDLAYDSRYWSMDPNLFYPERFLHEDKNHHLYAFLPFGAGHRACMGQDLALFELKVIAARLMQCVTFSDGGPVLNAGGMSGNVIKPKHIGVIISFDS